MRHVLVVANRTLGGPELVEEVRVRADQGCHVHVVVPATHSAEYERLVHALAESDVAPETLPDEEGERRARERLEVELRRLEAAGVVATGEVGDADPVVAVRDALVDTPVDEILLSTLPAGVSRWLGLDLPRRMERRFGLPLSVVEAQEEPVG